MNAKHKIMGDEIFPKNMKHVKFSLLLRFVRDMDSFNRQYHN